MPALPKPQAAALSDSIARLLDSHRTPPLPVGSVPSSAGPAAASSLPGQVSGPLPGVFPARSPDSLAVPRLDRAPVASLTTPQVPPLTLPVPLPAPTPLPASTARSLPAPFPGPPPPARLPSPGQGSVSLRSLPDHGPGYTPPLAFMPTPAGPVLSARPLPTPDRGAPVASLLPASPALPRPAISPLAVSAFPLTLPPAGMFGGLPLPGQGLAQESSLLGAIQSLVQVLRTQTGQGQDRQGAPVASPPDSPRQVAWRSLWRDS